ncbi:putative TetR-family transcriptional regulator [Actinoplanes missouriensis 431]|uniref:Putative TetR-family transcriptional regulator n=1 Tax=Actinoplanes missouriensis (strain ATCC 14538 / DSM 43046 / CBS 188.64 / JCM 3121 / NBRC 102363 / NCIMB 12654 / NRRL B-3342 / UNCC 431) TaxID=512565 RepID=I0H8X3_ACTM4|nr:putative TetR-family transcriptional regulator [Actinoplanes missouriensis 431]
MPEARQQLFAALERVIAAEGALTSRAVTQEAGVATGLLFTHFRNFDNFLIGYGVDRSFQIAASLAALPERLGSGTVDGNLSAAILALPLDVVLTLTRLTAFRPSLTAEVERVLGPGSAGLRVVAGSAAGYLAAEQELGRVPSGVDTASLALALAGVMQHVALTEGLGPEARARIGRAVTAICAPAPASRQGGVRPPASG